MSKSYQNIIFDWSGTVCDDFYQVYRCSMEVFKAYGVPELTFDEFKESFEYPYMPFYHKFSPEITFEGANAVFKRVIHRFDVKGPYPGVSKTLKELFGQGYKMVLFSGVPTERLTEEARRFDLLRYFSEVNGDIYDKTKEIKALLDRNGFDAERTVYVGDMDHDMKSARCAGVTAIGVVSGYQSEAQLQQGDPDYVIESAARLPALLRSLEL